MNNNQQQIKAIETRWAELVKHRMEHADFVLREVCREQRLAVIQELNENLRYEQHFEVMEEELRKLDPNHSYLEENQIN